MNKIIGKPLDRVDGRLKVTGEAPYTADVPIENLTYGVIFQSAIASGKIIQIDTTAAAVAPGVIDIITYQQTPSLVKIPFFGPPQPQSTEKDHNIYYDGQHLGVVIAQTLEQAETAASRIKIIYEEAIPTVTMAHTEIFEPESIFFGTIPAKITRGDIESGKVQADVLVEQVYTTPIEHHNPLEPSATIAMWEGDNLTLYETTQGVSATQGQIASILNIPEENVRVISKYLGGGFGCKALLRSHTILAAIAARQVKRPVKVVLTRSQMYTACGHRSETQQQLTLGATKEGKLTVIEQIGTSLTSQFDDFAEPVGAATTIMYACANLEIKYRLGRINAGTPTFMRGPGEAPGMFALESAMDELAYTLNIDPIELRLRNHADIDPHKGLPWSSKSLKECYQKGAEIFGWPQRNPVPRSMRENYFLIGWGMASATFPTNARTASVKVEIFATGEVKVQSGTQDIGTGTYTVMTQVAAEVLGLPVQFELGDTNFPKAPITGNSITVASVSPAVHQVAIAARDKMIKMAIVDANSLLYGSQAEDITVESGQIFSKQDPSKRDSYTDILRRHGLESLEVTEESSLNAESQQYAKHSFGAIFVEVAVDELLGEIKVRRCVGVYDAGRILNFKTARSQVIGGITWGIGMALMEKTVMDANQGRIVGANLSDYLIPVHADIPNMEVQFVEEHDPYVNALGTKSLGELPIVGVAAAISNAVYHATGKRIRDLPITPDKLL
ncbi:xanthine dehydrogenase family protein molybdopterin-binding subunit [Nostoc sp. 'Peltigera malacea cyanobiont' DB3992]|uniref:xanthine dehydrogenase family protein molybdopterin-binding subunit n=1 Tax=Nostoc sp. 'Peltigera malacea cyanobiont' DB3992 TaxID=1206980 RepID=UPI000C05237E|nr:xanthine dehydrogenase family protein molybdopterin-binding subunit [Nostoc sp. 'Peltigera malacea cyanobiont' DB3992]PHM08935.1 acylaldehyde oxidase [Nostoc sp. 'Peltigera malacea cyanobiont' DB3992]